LRPGDTVVDIGANIGTLSLCASSIVGDVGRVIAIEPHPRIFRYLRKNVQYNQRTNVICHNLAVGEADRLVSFSDKHSDDQNSVTTTDQGRINVPMRTLDGLLSAIGQISLLKIDTEGYEKMVFAGGTETLRRTQAVYFEVSAHSYTRFNASVPEVLAFLGKFDFSVYRFQAPTRLELIAAAAACDACENVLAIRPGSAFSMQRCQTLLGSSPQC